MKKPKITEGEWEIYIGLRMDMNVIASTSNLNIGSKHVKIESERVNAKAISAVPEMIDALIEYVECGAGPTSANIKAKQALKKAGV